jgi:hypothetical protein
LIILTTIVTMTTLFGTHCNEKLAGQEGEREDGDKVGEALAHGSIQIDQHPIVLEEAA